MTYIERAQTIKSPVLVWAKLGLGMFHIGERHLFIYMKIMMLKPQLRMRCGLLELPSTCKAHDILAVILLSDFPQPP
jgi:hypothetical protein